MNLKSHIPNSLTCGNLVCGCLALLKIFEGDLVWAAYLVGIAVIFDFFDGFTARLLKVSSPIGKDLDSLADMVTFGVVPGFMMYQLIILAKTGSLLTNFSSSPLSTFTSLFAEKPSPGIAYAALIIPVFSCIRLAKFNNDSRQSESFIGLPTPANGVFICSLPLIQHFNPEVLNTFQFVQEPIFLVALSFCLSLLLVAEIPLFALKFKSFGWKGNEIRFVFLIFSTLALVVLKALAIPLIILLYILFSIVNNIFLKKKV